MRDTACFLLATIVIGGGATLLMDAWTVVRKRLLGVPALDYALVGRWLGWIGRGRWFHHPIARSAPVRGERLLGWVAHYVTGVAFAAILLACWGLAWTTQPSLAPALVVGIGSVTAPFLVMQPAMGAGIAASRTPRPAVARMHSVVTHTVFGLGLYASGWLMRWATQAFL